MKPSGSVPIPILIENTCLQLECCRLTGYKLGENVAPVYENIQHNKVLSIVIVSLASFSINIVKQ